MRCQNILWDVFLDVILWDVKTSPSTTSMAYSFLWTKYYFHNKFLLNSVASVSNFLRQGRGVWERVLPSTAPHYLYIFHPLAWESVGNGANHLLLLLTSISPLLLLLTSISPLPQARWPCVEGLMPPCCSSLPPYPPSPGPGERAWRAWCPPCMRRRWCTLRHVTVTSRPWPTKPRLPSYTLRYVMSSRWNLQGNTTINPKSRSTKI